MLFELQLFVSVCVAVSLIVAMVMTYIHSVTKEMEKLGHDLEEVTGQLEESERQNQRLQRELEGVEDLHLKVRLVWLL